MRDTQNVLERLAHGLAAGNLRFTQGVVEDAHADVDTEIRLTQAAVEVAYGPAIALPQLTLNKVTVPPGDPGLFNLILDAAIVAPNVGNGGTSGILVVAAGPHQAAETAGLGTNLANYTVTFGGDAAPDGSVTVASGESKVIIITNMRRTENTARGGTRRMVVLIPNHWDRCLAADGNGLANMGPQQTVCDPFLFHDINWIRAPKNYIPFRKTGAIPTPLPGPDSQIMSFQVPDGYDGMIAALFHLYNGPGFLEGNGDIEWRLLVNRTYAVHLGRVLVTLGSIQQSFPIQGGIQIQSGQRISYIVSAPNLSGGILPLASQIVCGVEGLFYART